MSLPYCLLLDRIFQCGADGAPTFVDAPPIDNEHLRGHQARLRGGPATITRWIELDLGQAHGPGSRDDS